MTGKRLATLEWEGWRLEPLNKLLRAGHWAKRRKMLSPPACPTYMQLVGEAMVCAPHPRRAVVVTRIGPRKLDEDGLVASAKPVLDSIKCFKLLGYTVSNLIYDDSPEYCKLHVLQETGGYGVRVVIYEEAKR